MPPSFARPLREFFICFCYNTVFYPPPLSFLLCNIFCDTYTPQFHSMIYLYIYIVGSLKTVRWVSIFYSRVLTGFLFDFVIWFLLFLHYVALSNWSNKLIFCYLNDCILISYLDLVLRKNKSVFCILYSVFCILQLNSQNG